MTTTVLRPEATVTVTRPGGGGTTTPVKVDGGNLTLDALAIPYVQGRIDVAYIDDLALGDLDPRQDVRVNISARRTPADAPRTFNVQLRERRVDHTSKMITVDVASDEAMLDDYATLTLDTSAFASKTSLRGICNYVLGKIGAALAAAPANDADMTPYSDATNYLTNPAAIVDLTGWIVAGGAAILRQTGVSAMANSAKTSFRINGNASGNATFIETTLTSPPSGKLRFQARQLNGSTALTGAQNASYLNLTVMYSINSGKSYVYTSTTPGPTAANGTKDHVLYIDVPPNVTTMKVRLIHGVTSAAVLYWSDVMVTDDNGDPGDVVYWDGSTPDTAGYDYEWQDVVGSSRSIRSALIDRTPELLTWTPGVTAWDFLEPLTTQAGLRLFCDELRVWRLINPYVYALPGQLAVSGVNGVSGDDTISRDDADVFCTGVVVVYEWVDQKTGARKTATDSAGTPAKVFVQEYKSAYPGPGAAAAILKGRNGTGRVQDVTALVDWAANPSMSAAISLPGAPTQQGKVASVRFSLDDDALMQVGTGGLTDLPDGAIDKLTGTIDALAGTIDALYP